MVSERNKSIGRAVLGLYLILIGALLIASNLGFDIPQEVWSYWPFLVIGLGAAKLAFAAGDRDTVSSGIWLLLGGLYCWISVWGLWGLSWSTAWPIFVVAGGISMILDPWWSSRRCVSPRAAGMSGKEKDHVG